MVLTPANGRDYDSQVDVLAGFNSDQDFKVQSEGRLVNRAAVEAEGVDSVRIRYHQLSRVVILDRVDGRWVLP